MFIKDLCNYLDNRFPASLAWDEDLNRIGLIIGSENIKLTNVLLTLDVTLEVVDEAIKNNANLIITHHPLIFMPIYKVVSSDYTSLVIQKLIKYDISVYCMHTNYDVGYMGVNDSLAKLIGLSNINGDNEKDSYLRYGKIKEVRFGDFISYLKEKLNINNLRCAGDLNKKISTVGILGGSGGREVDVINALKSNIDLYISSEFRLNAVQIAARNNLCIIELNHGIEKLAFSFLKEELKNNFKTINVLISNIETDPFNN